MVARHRLQIFSLSVIGGIPYLRATMAASLPKIFPVIIVATAVPPSYGARALSLTSCCTASTVWVDHWPAAGLCSLVLTEPRWCAVCLRPLCIPWLNQAVAPLSCYTCFCL